MTVKSQEILPISLDLREIEQTRKYVICLDMVHAYLNLQLAITFQKPGNGASSGQDDVTKVHERMSR